MRIPLCTKYLRPSELFQDCLSSQLEPLHRVGASQVLACPSVYLNRTDDSEELTLPWVRGFVSRFRPIVLLCYPAIPMAHILTVL